MRDLGGYPAAGGKYTKYHRFVRSNAPVSALDEEAQLLRDLNVTTIVDLRSTPEVEARPNILASLPGFTYYNFPLNDDGAVILTEDDMEKSYFTIVSNQGATLRKIFGAFAAAPAGVLYHCAIGKDRTGVVSALLLLLAGVSKDDVVADYQVTYTYIKKRIDKLVQDYPGTPAFLGMSKPKFILGFIRLMEVHYGSAEECLLQNGVSPEEIAAIRAKLLEDAT